MSLSFFDFPSLFHCCFCICLQEYSLSVVQIDIIFYFYGKNMTTTVLSDFEVLSLIGSGSFAEVFKVKRKADGQIYAMKKVRT